MLDQLTPCQMSFSCQTRAPQVVLPLARATPVERNLGDHVHRLEDLCAPAPLRECLIGVGGARSGEPRLDGRRHLALALVSVGIRPGKTACGWVVVAGSDDR